jgi:hypothetical protein
VAGEKQREIVIEVTVRQSGDGFELLDAQGKAIAWTLEKKWALKILLGLELLNDGTVSSKFLADLHNYIHDDDDT